MQVKHLTTPLTTAAVLTLKAGQAVLISGVLYTARDAAHQRLAELQRTGKTLPFDLEGQLIYYVGPAPAKPGQVIGSAGPTTSGRMDLYTPGLLAQGLKGCIGKGARSQAVKDALVKYQGVYLAATGGAGALLAQTVRQVTVVAYPELGPEAIYRLAVENFPATVINDAYGNDFYVNGQKQYARPISEPGKDENYDPGR
ncbi:MAG TPA: Fe-S-containing hydro-lyase [Oscillospiraceae bacterium]|nr:Fe-S-containing hydro-lyase [Oscillospiraceae bacterium]